MILWQKCIPSSKGQHKSLQATAVLHKLDPDGLPAQQVPSRPKGCWDRALHFGLSCSHAELQTTKLALKQLSSSSIGWSRWDGTSFSIMIFPVCQTSVTPCWTVANYRCLSLYHCQSQKQLPKNILYLWMGWVSKNRLWTVELLKNNAHLKVLKS